MCLRPCGVIAIKDVRTAFLQSHKYQMVREWVEASGFLVREWGFAHSLTKNPQGVGFWQLEALLPAKTPLAYPENQDFMNFR